MKYFASELSEEALYPVKSALVGIVAHGCGHLWVANGGIQMDSVLAENEGTPVEKMQAFCVLAFFWFAITATHRNVIGNFAHLAFATVFLVAHYWYI